VIPVLPAVFVGVAVAAAGAVAYSRREKKLTATQVGLAQGSPSGGTFTAAIANVVPIKQTLSVRAVKKAPPQRLAKQTPAEKLETWKQSHAAVYLKYEGCKNWYWGFNVLQVATDAAAYGGAGVVASIIDMILSFTALGEVTDYLNLKFKFKLEKYSIAEADSDGYYQETASSRKRIDYWTDAKHDVPPVPLPPGDGKWVAAWIDKRVGGIYAGEDDKIITVFAWRNGRWQWTWLIATKELRALLRHDKINLSTIAKHQCGKGKWWFTFRRYVDEIYK
jgi:hypothetical protein